MHADARQVPISILKVDDEQRLIWGWASVIEENGVPVVDLQGDIIEENELEKAFYEFMAESRVGGTMHARGADGEVIKTGGACGGLVFTHAVQKILGIDIRKVAALVVMRVTDDEQWAVVKRGELSALSIGATAIRVPVEIDQ